MNGIHDLGGMHGFGPVEHDPHEPPFAHDWEPAVIAIQRATRGRGDGLINIDEFRHGIERMDPAHYLASSYFEHWLDGIARILAEKGIVESAALAERVAYFEERPEARAADALTAPPPAPTERPRDPFRRSSWRESDTPPRFAPGDAVRARTTAPQGHTRLPRYIRGKQGVIEAFRGVHVFPDTNAHGLGEQPQPVYSVRFTARELWGVDAEPNHTLNIDLWESYLTGEE